MVREHLPILRWDGPELILSNDEGDCEVSRWYIGNIPERQREEVLRCLQKAYQAGRASMRLDIKELLS